MNRITTLMLLLIISSFTLVNANAGDEVNHQATFNVEKMTCATCPITIRKAIQGVEGVKEVTVDYDSKTATVIYDSVGMAIMDVAAAKLAYDLAK